MLDHLKYLKFLSVLILAIKSCYTNFVYGEFSGNLINKNGIKFSLYIKSLNGTIFYGVDSFNKVLIAIHHDEAGRYLNIKFNRYSVLKRIRIANICECKDCANLYMTFDLLLDQFLMNVTCDKKSTTIYIKDLLNNDEFSSYPLPRYYDKSQNQTSFWIGNIGPYYGNNFKYYIALKAQLIGCLDEYKFNKQVLKLSQNGTKFLSSCNIIYNERFCNRTICENKKVFYKMYDCSSQSMNGIYCQAKLQNYSKLLNSYSKIKSNEGFIFFRLEWIKQSSKRNNLPLLEIKLKDDSLLLIHLNVKNQLVIHSDNETYFETAIPKNSRNILLMYFYKNKTIIVKFFDGAEITTFKTKVRQEFSLINVGFFQHNSRYSDFKGKMSFIYNSSYWRRISDSNEFSTVSPNLNDNIVQKISIYGFILILIAIFGLVIIVIAKKITSKIYQKNCVNSSKISLPSSNNYELMPLDGNVQKVIQTTYSETIETDYDVLYT